MATLDANSNRWKWASRNNCSNLCYFGQNQFYCQCEIYPKIPQNACLSVSQNPLLASDRSECPNCEGICKAEKECIECSQQKWPIYDTQDNTFEHNWCHKICVGCLRSQQNDCIECIFYSNRNTSNNSCQCPDFSFYQQKDQSTQKSCQCQETFKMTQNPNGEYFCECKEQNVQVIQNPDGSYSYGCKSDSHILKQNRDGFFYCYFLQKSDINCLCPAFSKIDNTQTYCECQQGYFDLCKECQTTIECIKCDSSCLNCSGPKKDECLSCHTGYYFEEGECKTCFDDCLSCSFFPQCDLCLKQGYSSNKNGVCKKDCKEGKYENEDSCYDCPDLCLTCSSYTHCITCSENSQRENGVCECLQGFFQFGSDCQGPASNFTAFLEVSSENVLKIFFIKTCMKLLK